MPDNEKRKMAFYELGRGKLALDMQAAFEHIQKSAFELGADTSVQLTIKVSASKDEKYGGVEWEIKKTFPKQTSIKHTTELGAGGVIISDGTSKIDVLQEELKFNETKIHKISGGGD